MTEKTVRSSMRFSGDGLLSAVAAAVFVPGAFFYFIGRTERAAFLRHFGIEGAVEYDSLTLMAGGAPGFLASLGGFGLGTFVGWLVFRFVTQNGRKPRSFHYATAWLYGILVSFICVVGMALWTASFRADQIKSSVAEDCSHCSYYHLTGGAVYRGEPIAADNSRLAVYTAAGSVKLIPWDEVQEVSAKKQVPRQTQIKRTGQASLSR